MNAGPDHTYLTAGIDQVVQRAYAIRRDQSRGIRCSLACVSNAFDEKPGNVMLHRSRELIAHNAMRELGRSRGGKKRRRFELERQPARQHHRRSTSGLDALLRHFYAPCWINREAAAPQELSAKVSRTAWLLVGHGGAAHLFAQSDAPRGSRKTTSRLTAIPINYRLHNKFDSMQQILI
jgi:hypothetical protein